MDSGIGPDLRIYKTLNNKEFTAFTLRDYFAAHAIVGLYSVHGTVSEGDSQLKNGDQYASAAYKIADAMIAARDK